MATVEVLTVTPNVLCPGQHAKVEAQTIPPDTLVTWYIGPEDKPKEKMLNIGQNTFS